MNFNRLFLALAIVGKLVLATLICMYFWNASELIEIKQLPIQILVFAVIYIGLQMLTRKMTNVNNWWDWIYYLGLVSIMVPVMLADVEHAKLYHAITDYGTILLILPVLVDGYNFINKPSKQ